MNAIGNGKQPNTILLKVYLCFFVTSDKEQLAFNKCTSYKHLKNHSNQTHAYNLKVSRNSMHTTNKHSYIQKINKPVNNMLDDNFAQKVGLSCNRGKSYLKMYN